MSIRCMESLGLAGWSYGGKFYELKVHLNIFCIVFDVVCYKEYNGNYYIVVCLL